MGAAMSEQHDLFGAFARAVVDEERAELGDVPDGWTGPAALPHNGPRIQTLATPQELVDEWARYLKIPSFTVDVCAMPETAKAPEFFSPAHADVARRDGLRARWYGWAWCNPPYDDILPWVVKAAQSVEQKHADGVVVLLPVRTRKWFHFALEHPLCDVYFCERRISFEGSGDSPFEDSLCLLWRP